jgi:hypothetical protein
MDVFHQNAQLLNKYTIAQIMTSESIIAAIRKEMKKLFPEIKVEQENILDIILNDVLKREVLEGDKVKDAQVRIKKAQSKIAKAATQKPARTANPSTEAVPESSQSEEAP